ncbi:probable general transcription factor IIE subunit 2 at C-terminar half [Coccomyxa sp. Obi]|nr:probable general transcription factor IIE subunit 2 at C-terminar half [Coccomyxa sp. Obi]
MAENLQKALEAFRKRQAQLASDSASAAPKKRAAPKKDGNPKSGRGRGRGAEGERPVSGKEAVRTSVARSTVPLAKQIKNVLDYLLADRTATLSAADISERFGHDASPGTPLHMALAANDKIEVLPDGSFAYKAAHELSDKRQLYAHLLRAPDGTYSGALKDAYPTVMDDIAALRNEGLIWLLPSVDVGGDDVLYPREERPMISVSPDVAALWHEVTVPADPDALEEELRRAGIAPAPRSGPRRRPPPAAKQKAKRAYRPRNVTNIHMPELFADAGPTQID